MVSLPSLVLEFMSPDVHTAEAGSGPRTAFAKSVPEEDPSVRLCSTSGAGAGLATDKTMEQRK